MTGRGDGRRPRYSGAPAAWPGRGALRLPSATASDPLCRSRALSPRSGAALPSRSAPQLPGPIESKALATRPHTAAPLPIVPARTRLPSLTLGGERPGAAWSRDPQAGSGERGAPCCSAAGRRPGLAARAPPFSLVPQINPKHRAFHLRVDLT